MILHFTRPHIIALPSESKTICSPLNIQQPSMNSNIRPFTSTIGIGSDRVKSRLPLLSRFPLLPNHPPHYAVTFAPTPQQHQSPVNRNICLGSLIPLDILLKLRKNDKSLRVSTLIAVNYPHDMPKGTATRNLPGHW